ncbi:glycosyltransferase family 2 protein [Leuconostoc gasicomitatum]|uniref:glycosyltransferase family 2 protein n=1 Tax=Leuconostoc gasicomitatum TaxID=115778 RepID=UPI001CC419C2|nr:glycosyltransferase family A protein [Leuconostoc gasicomitatum]MBZ5946339.1 glycosyltransferase family 2 protein [Leuconostoc gasicomitatum]
MKYSIIIPVYNVSKYLEEALDSIDHQTFDDYEAIIVNDGSTDDSEKIIDSFIAKNKRFKKINIDNSGQGAARNRGVSEAEGDYLIFLDSDDILDIELLNKLNQQDADADVIVYDYINFEGTKNNILKKNYFPENMVNYGVVAWNKAYKKSFWDKNVFLFPVGIKYEDTPLVHIIMGLSTKNVKMIGKSGYYYRQNRKNSIINEASEGDILMRFNALKIMNESIKIYHKKLTDIGNLNVVYMKLGKELIYLIIMAFKNKTSKDELYQLFRMTFSEPIKSETFKLGGMKSKLALISLSVFFFINYKLLPGDRKKYV